MSPATQAVTQQGDVFLQLGRVLQKGQRAGVDRLVLGTLGQTRPQQVGDGRVHRLLPALNGETGKSGRKWDGGVFLQMGISTLDMLVELTV